ncbi:MAG TPA: phosphoribosyl-ATP diphosphatase [Prolixibacteraceae bacterium]|nr:phosphoribosyl-ATP diphosphatase [Prolixibacteraceae bacterium]
MNELSDNQKDLLFLSQLQDFIIQRKEELPGGSYTTSLFREGTRKIAQKVGEEAVETIIGAMANDDENFLYEGADLLYHLIVLLTQKGYRIEDLVRELKRRHR